MLSFIERLKSVIYEVDQTGGDKLERLVPDPALVQRLKEHTVKRLRELPGGVNDNRLLPFLLEEFYEGFFDEKVRESLIFLSHSGVNTTSELEEILKKAVDRRIIMFVEQYDKSVFDLQIGTVIEEGSLALEAQTFLGGFSTIVTLIWEDGGTEVSQTYTFARQRALIAWDYTHSRWYVTNLGLFFLELNPFQATCFLLTVDTVLSTGDHDFRHISRSQLAVLLDTKQSDPPLIPLHRATLINMGILSESNSPDRPSVTPLGKVALERVLGGDNLMMDTVILLLQSEERGFPYAGQEIEVQKLEEMLNSRLVDEANRQSIQNAISLGNQRQYLDGLRILFPCIEGVINSMLQSMGEQPDKYPGWKAKVDYLEFRGVIPSDIAKAVEIITSRNKTLHGQFVPPEPEYAYPLFQMAVTYLRRILSVWESSKHLDSRGTSANKKMERTGKAEA